MKLHSSYHISYHMKTSGQETQWRVLVICILTTHLDIYSIFPRVNWNIYIYMKQQLSLKHPSASLTPCWTCTHIHTHTSILWGLKDILVCLTWRSWEYKHVLQPDCLSLSCGVEVSGVRQEESKQKTEVACWDCNNDDNELHSVCCTNPGIKPTQQHDLVCLAWWSPYEALMTHTCTCSRASG